MFIKRLYNRFLSLLKAVPGEIYVFLVAFIYRLPTLGYDSINNDVFHWKERGYAFGSALTSLNFAGTAVTYHPGVPLLWSQFVAIKIYSTLLKLGVLKYVDSHEEFLVNNYIQMLVVVFLTSVLVAIAYRQLKRIAGIKLALITIIFILIEPFYLALSRALHTDVMISLFMFISVLYFYSYIKSENKKLVVSDAIFAGIFAGLAFLTKSSGLFLIPFFVLVAGIYFINLKNTNLIYKALVVLGFSLATFFIVWPAMWVTPIESLNLYLFRGIQGIAIEEGHEHLWFGELTPDPGPAFYPIVLIGRYSLILFTLFLASLYLFFRNRKKITKDNLYSFLGILLLFILFYLLMITVASKKLDRYSLPIVYPMAVLAAWAATKIFSKKLLVWCVVGLIIFRGLLFYGIHPNYLAYYSPLIGGVEGGRYIIEPKWLIGYDKVAKYFNEKQKEDDKEIVVAIADFDYLRPFAEFEVVNIKHEVERNTADYLVVPAFQEDKNEFYKNMYLLKQANDVIKIAGVEYYNIYKIEK